MRTIDSVSLYNTHTTERLERVSYTHLSYFSFNNHKIFLFQHRINMTNYNIITLFHYLRFTVFTIILFKTEFEKVTNRERINQK